MQLPDDLRTALEAELNKVPSKEMARAVRDLSQRYRTQRRQSDAPHMRSIQDVAAYTAYRLPATFAAIRAVLMEVRDRRADLQPKTLLDLGAGPGTAAWAAVEVWPELERIIMLERDARMIQMGRNLGSGSRLAALRDAHWCQIDVTARWQVEPAQVTIAAYAVGEMPAPNRAACVRQLWDHAEDTCIIIEPGTPRAFAVVRPAGDELVRAGAHILAPFPHDWRCLETEEDWCHFSQRVPRTRLHRAAKEATLSYEDEKYSYVAASRRSGSPIAARVIRQPQLRSGHVRLVLCTASGIKHVVVPRSKREAYVRAKELAWGSAIPVEDATFFGLLP